MGAGYEGVGLVDREPLRLAVGDQVLELTAMGARAAVVVRMVTGVHPFGVRHLPVGVAQPEERRAVGIGEVPPAATNADKPVGVDGQGAFVLHALNGSRTVVEPRVVGVRACCRPCPCTDRSRSKTYLPGVLPVPERFAGYALPLWTGKGRGDRNVLVRMVIGTLTGQVQLRDLPARDVHG